MKSKRASEHHSAQAKAERLTAQILEDIQSKNFVMYVERSNPGLRVRPRKKGQPGLVY